MARVAAKRHEARIKAEAPRKLSKLYTAYINQCTACVNGSKHEAARARVLMKEHKAQRFHAMFVECGDRWARIMKVLHEVK